MSLVDFALDVNKGKFFLTIISTYQHTAKDLGIERVDLRHNHSYRKDNGDNNNNNDGNKNDDNNSNNDNNNNFILLKLGLMDFYIINEDGLAQIYLCIHERG